VVQGLQIGVLVRAIGREPQELPLHRIDVRDIGRDEVIAAASPKMGGRTDADWIDREVYCGHHSS
jgi:hypothetical protein